MTLIENNSPKAQYTAPFIKGQLLPLTFPYIDKTDVHMLIDGVEAELNREFDIITEVSEEHPVAYPNSAYLKIDLPNAKQITLYRSTPLDQQAPFPQGSKFRSERIEQALDKLTMQQQEQRETLNRCMKASIAIESFDGAIPIPEPNRALKINSTGTGFELSDFDPDQAMIYTEDFKNQAQEAAAEAAEQASEAKSQAQTATNQAQVATDRVEEITALYDTYTTDLYEKHDTYVTDIVTRGDTIIKDADAIIDRIGLNLFDMVKKDHILTYEESKGFALQGTWVYKNAIAGERYGYPDFYNKCLEELSEAKSREEIIKPNVHLTGPVVVDSENRMHGITNTGFAILPEIIPDTTDLEVVMKIQSHVNVPNVQYFWNASSQHVSWLVGVINGIIVTYMSSNGSTWNIADNKRGTTYLEPVKSYWVKLRFDGAQYYIDLSTNGVDYFNEMTIVNPALVFRAGAPTLGKGWDPEPSWHITMFLDETYINIDGKRWWSGVDRLQYKQHANGHKLYDISNKGQVDKWFETYGTSPFYGVDTKNERILLPTITERKLIKSKKSTDKDRSWYNIYSDGWCEQGAYVTNIQDIESYYGFRIPFSVVQDVSMQRKTITNSRDNTIDVNTDFGFIWGVSNTGFYSWGAWHSNSEVYWHACGYVTVPETEQYDYVCVGNTVSDTSWVDVVTQVNEGVKDLEDATQACLSDIEAKSTELRSKMALQMFDTILKDHVLSYEETLGLALQGTWVHKNAKAGVYHGYSDFYHRCLREFKDTSNTVETIRTKIRLVGSATLNSDKITGFGVQSYASIPAVFPAATASSWEINLKIITGSDFSHYNDFLGIWNGSLALGIEHTTRKFTMALGNTNSSWNINNVASGSHTVTDNTTYYIRVKFTGEIYTFEYSLDGKNYILDIRTASTARITSGTPTLGQYDPASTSYFSGSIDLAECYIDVNGKRWWNGIDQVVRHQNGHLFYDIADKDRMDGVFAEVGVLWAYGVDEENERIFLPRNNFFEQATGDISEVGQSVEAGLPNITGSFYARCNRNATEAFSATYVGAGQDYWNGVDNNSHYNVTFNAAKSNPIYGNNDTVQPNAAKKLLYICVGNTLADTSWVNPVVQVAKGVQEIEAVINTGISTLNTETQNNVNDINAAASQYDNITYRNIANCLLEVPQRIKLELNNGVLTLKAGSEVIVPNGFEADGVTPKFDYVTVNKDYADVQWETVTATNVFEIYNPDANDNRIYPWAHTFSGETAPTGYTHMVWYDTKNNLVKLTGDSGASWASGIALPLSIQNYSNGLVTSINQVFNGFGYIGQCTWVDKGVKSLLADGRNEDGTLKNRVVTTTTCNVNDATTRSSLKCFFNGQYIEDYGVDHMFEQDTPPSNWGGLYARWYNPKENLSYLTDDGGATWYLHDTIYLGDLVKPVYENIISFNIQAEPLRTITSSDKTSIRHWCTPNYNAGIGLALTNGVVPCDGYLFVMNHQDRAPVFYLGNAGWQFIGSYYSTNLMTVPVKRGQAYSCSNWGEIRLFALYPFT